MGKAISKVGQAVGLVADPDAGSGAYAEANALARRAVSELEKLGVPSIEAQKIALQLPEVVGQLDAEQLDASAFEDIIEDPALRENVLKAIQGTEELAETGFGVEDRARLDAMRRATQADEQARQSSILQSFAERGALGSGSELAARLSSAQGTADRASQDAVQLAAQGQSQRRAALGDLASMSSGLRAQDLSKAQNAASARDQFSQFNALQRANVQQQNLAEQQRMADTRTNLKNQQQQYNKGLIQQDYQNKLNKATGMAGQYQNLAQNQMQQGQSQAAAAQSQAAGNRGLLTSAATMGLGAYKAGMFSNDGGVKYEDGGISKEKIEGMIEALKMVEKGPNQIVDNPYTQSAEENVMEDIIDNDVNPMIMPDTGMIVPASRAGKLYNEGGVESPVSYAADGERIDEKIDNGELEYNEPAQEELMDYLRGNVESEDMTEGRIIPGASYSGDMLPDRINSGEMVINGPQQDRMKADVEEKDAELEGYRKLIKLLGKM